MPAPYQDDDLSPLYRSVRDAMDGARWDQTLAAARRPQQVQTPEDVRSLVASIAPQHGVDPRLVEAVIGLESGGQPGAQSRKGAQGLMQLMPGTARRFGVTDPFDPAQNVEGGVRYLAWLRDQFPGRTDLQLAAYHAGEGAVRNAGYAIPNTTDGHMLTQQYVQTILSRYQPTLPGESGTPGVDVSGAMARQAVRGGTQGPTLQVNPNVGQMSQQARQAQQRATSQLPGTSALPGESGLPALDVSREIAKRPMDTGTPLQVEADVGRLMERTQGQPTALQPGQKALPEFPTLEPSIVEDRAGRILGSALSDGIGFLGSLVQDLIAKQNLVGLKRPDVPGMTDPMGIEFITPIIKAAQEATGPRVGEQGRDFVDMLAGAAGTSLVSLLPGAAALKFLRGVGAVAPGLARLGGAATSGIIEASGESGNLFEQLAPIVGEDEAARRSLKSFATNVILVTATDKLGIFGESANLLRRTLGGVIANGAQEALQYDIERRQLWVPANHQAAEALKAQGWLQEGSRVAKPFEATEAGEAALIGMLIGGPAAAAVSLAVEQNSTPWDNIREQEAQTAGGAVDEHFSLASVVEAAQQPDTPREGVQPSVWKRWGDYLTNLLPEPTGGGGFLSNQRGAVGGGRMMGMQPSLRLGAEGLPRERYRTASGGWVIPRRDIPAIELELKDFIGQMGGIQLEGEELHGELEALISRKQTGLYGLQNNIRGVSLQQMAEQANELGFIATADKESLLDALDRSVTMGEPVYSTYSTGRIPLIDDPFVQQGYQAVLDAVEAMKGRTEEQIGGVRHRAEVYAEGQEMRASGMMTLEDIKEIFPNTTLNDAQAAAMLQSMNEVGEAMAGAAQAYLDGGERIGSREEASLRETMALVAELEPIRMGVSAAQSRGLGILNDPLSRYTQYLNNLHKVLEQAPEHTMGTIARRILAAKPQEPITPEMLRNNPALLQQLWEQMEATILRFEARAAQREAMEPQGAWRALPVNQQLSFLNKLGGMNWNQADMAGAVSVQGFLQEHMDQDALDKLNNALRPWGARQEQLTLPVLQALVQSTKPGFEGYFLELMYNAQLSNPATHIANFVSNSLVTAWAIPERFLAEQYRHAGPDNVARGESAAMLYGLVHGIQDAWAVAAMSWQAGKPLSGIGRETTRTPAMTAANVGLDPSSAAGKLFDFWFEYIGMASGGRMPTRALMAADEFFKMLNYRMELNALAYREATRQGYEGTAWGEHVARVVSSPNLSQLQHAATDFGVYQTFQQALQPGTVGAAIQGFANLGKRIPWTDQTLPYGRVLVPYIQTPANIASYAMERTPLGMFMEGYQADLEAGGARADIAQAKVDMGTFTMVALAGLALTGRLTGRGPEDPELRDIWLQSHQPYSVRLFSGPWMSLERFEPVGMLAGMIGDMVQVAGEADMELWKKATVAPFFIFLRNVTSKTYFQGLNNFFSAVSPNAGTKEEQFEDRIGRWATRTGTGLAQPSAFLAATARAIDPAEKDAKGLIDALYARIPGWSGWFRSGVASRRTIGGEKILYGLGFDPAILANTIRAYSPAKMAEAAISPVDRQILDNKIVIERPTRSLGANALEAGQMADAVSEYPQLSHEGLRLTEAQYEKFAVLAAGNQAEAATLGLEVPTPMVQRLVRALGKQYDRAPPASIVDLDTYLDWMIQQPEYQQASPGPDGGKATQIKVAVYSYRKLGLTLLLAQDTALRARYTESEINKATRTIPLEQRPAVQAQAREQYERANTKTQERLGLRVGAPR